MKCSNVKHHYKAGGKITLLIKEKNRDQYLTELFVCDNDCATTDIYFTQSQPVHVIY